MATAITTTFEAAVVVFQTIWEVEITVEALEAEAATAITVDQTASPTIEYFPMDVAPPKYFPKNASTCACVNCGKGEKESYFCFRVSGEAVAACDHRIWII